MTDTNLYHYPLTAEDYQAQLLAIAREMFKDHLTEIDACDMGSSAQDILEYVQQVREAATASEQLAQLTAGRLILESAGILSAKKYARDLIRDRREVDAEERGELPVKVSSRFRVQDNRDKTFSVIDTHKETKTGQGKAVFSKLETRLDANLLAILCTFYDIDAQLEMMNAPKGDQ